MSKVEWREWAHYSEGDVIVAKDYLELLPPHLVRLRPLLIVLPIITPHIACRLT